MWFGWAIFVQGNIHLSHYTHTHTYSSVSLNEESRAPFINEWVDQKADDMMPTKQAIPFPIRIPSVHIESLMYHGSNLCACTFTQHNIKLTIVNVQPPLRSLCSPYIRRGYEDNRRSLQEQSPCITLKWTRSDDVSISIFSKQSLLLHLSRMARILSWLRDFRSLK